MVVAMFAVLAVDVSLDDVVDVAVVRDRDVVAAYAVHVVSRMGAAGVLRIAGCEVRGGELMFVDVVAVWMVQVPVVNVIDVVVVDHREVAASRAVLVLVPVVHVVFLVTVVHGSPSPSVRSGRRAPRWPPVPNNLLWLCNADACSGRSTSFWASGYHACRSSA